MPVPLIDVPVDLLAELRRVRAGADEDRDAALSALGLRPLTGGMQNDLYLWTPPRGDDVVIKLYVKTDRQRVAREWAALTLLAPHQLGTVPTPLWHDDAPAEPAIGMTRLHGQPLIEATDQLAALRALAHTTTQLQAVPLTGLLATLPRIDTGEHYMVRLTQAWPDLLASQPNDPLTPAMQQLLAAWQRSGDADMVAAPAAPVLSRGDANLLNWMTTDNGAACVDFEYAGFSNVAFDAADLIEHISARAVPDSIWTQLLPDLGVTNANRHQFAANQRTCALRWLAVLWKQRDRRREEFTVQHERVELLYSSANPYA
ncbi:phosphotransferase family protein [Micromonospora chalcea]|uniref:phosphotransferase family protein n=1 Tax=Micromonospora chalcea TaxID=1874 RepID=UPI0021A7CB09|nr:aminoglycoside phosphotransferase family protein [Micromonospora chalcea]MCT2279773.1 aminoglycoside phosphotransferase family protein [Micromonospora chalcea]